MTGSAKQSIAQRNGWMDCFVARAPRNDETSATKPRGGRFIPFAASANLLLSGLCRPLRPVSSAQRRPSKSPKSGEKTMKRVACLVAASLLSLPAIAHTPQQPPHQSFAEGDLKLE